MSQVPDFSKVRALVIGDVMLDRYWHGDTSRISPEAPVPVMRVTDDDYRLGGAANVAFNMAQLGCQVSIMGVVGIDEAADELQRQIEMKQMRFIPEVSENAQTIVKLRVMSRHQQLMRLDFENTKTSPAISAQQVSSDLLKNHDVVILSDYAKGALSQCGQLIATIKKSGVPILVDPKGHDFSKYSGASIITPNMSEFEAVVGECESDAAVESQGRDLMSQLQLDALLVTRSEKGITLLQGDESPWHMPTQAKDVFDVTGAGDTVIATLAACVGAGESYQSAARWANIAAGIVVGKSGTSSVTVSELQAANDQLHLSSRGVFSESEVKQLVKTAQAQGEKVVVTNGCFDILHAGHVTYLQEAAKLGDRLVVAVNSDETVRELKGPERPVNPVDNRMTVLSALACVDWVVRFDEMTPERLICELKPDFLVKGGDNDPANIPGNQCVWNAGGQVFALTYVDGVSTTQIVESIKKEIIMPQPLKLDVAIFGGGIAGLWTLARLLKQGFNAHLFECHQVGGGQSIASQGIIHGGTKYALTGKITGASEAIREMPAIWNQCLSGKGEIDLSSVKVNSTHQLLWTQANLKSKVGGFFASKVMSSRMTKLQSDEVPEIFRDANFKGTVYRLDEQVLDPKSLFQCLFDQLSDHMSFYSADQLALNSEGNGQFKIDELSFDAMTIIFTAGEGNEQLLLKAGLKQPFMQRRPLHMPMVKSSSLPQLTAHALGDGTVPRMTITANTDKAGNVVWYLGGKIAEEGVSYTADELIQKAKDELNSLLPWMDWRSMQWSTLMINRAEPLMADGSRPDRPHVQRNNKIITAWPVKLAFAPLVAKEIEDQVRGLGVEPSHSKVMTDLPKPPLSNLPWDEVISWT